MRTTEIHPEAKRFISAEPLLADLGGLDLTGINWVIAGGESGNGARPFHLDHALRLYESCERQHVAFWFKQVGEVTMDGGRQLEMASSLHDLSVVPDKYAAMIRRDRPEAWRYSESVKPNPRRLTKLRKATARPSPEAPTAITIEHQQLVDSQLGANIERWVARQFPSGELKVAEGQLRPQLIQALGSLRRSRFETGRLLTEYRKLFRGTFNGLLGALAIKRRTGFDLIEDYERAKVVPEPVRAAAALRGFDLAEKKHKDLAFTLTSDVAGLNETQASKMVDDAIKADAERRAKAKADASNSKPELVQITAPLASLEVAAKAKLGEDEYRRRYEAFLKSLVAESDQIAA